MNMRKTLPLFLAALLMPTLLWAQTPQPSSAKTGLTFSVGSASSEISFRRLLSPQWAALGTLGYSKGTLYSAGGGMVGISNDVTTWSIGLAGRRYMAAADLRPFLEVGAGVRIADAPNCDGPRSPYGTAGGGVEYNIAPRVSIEGSAGLGYSSISQRCKGDNIEYRFDNDSYTTFRTALSITFYF